MGNPLGGAPHDSADFTPIRFTSEGDVVHGEISSVKKEGEITIATATFKFTDAGGLEHEHQVTYKHKGDISTEALQQKFHDNMNTIAVLATRYLGNASETKAVSYNAGSGQVKKFADAEATTERKQENAETRTYKNLTEVITTYQRKVANKTDEKRDSHIQKWSGAVTLAQQISYRLSHRSTSRATTQPPTTARSAPPPPPSAPPSQPASSTARSSLSELDDLLADLESLTPTEGNATRTAPPPPPPSTPPPQSSVERSRTPPPPLPSLDELLDQLHNQGPTIQAREPQSSPEIEIAGDDSVPEPPPSFDTPQELTPARRLSDTPLPGALNSALSEPSAPLTPEELSEIDDIMSDEASSTEEMGSQQMSEPREPDELDRIIDEYFPETAAAPSADLEPPVAELEREVAPEAELPSDAENIEDEGFTIGPNLATENATVNASVNPLLRELVDTENTFFNQAAMLKEAYSKLGDKKKKIPSLNSFNLAIGRNFEILKQFNEKLQQTDQNNTKAFLELYESPIGKDYVRAMGEILIYKAKLTEVEGNLKKYLKKIKDLPEGFDPTRIDSSILAQRLPRHELFLKEMQKKAGNDSEMNDRIESIKINIQNIIVSNLKAPSADLETKMGQRDEMEKISTELAKKSPPLMKMKFSNQMANILSGDYPQEVLNDTSRVLRPHRSQRIADFKEYELNVYKTVNEYLTVALEKLRTQTPNTALTDEVIKTVKENINSDALKYVLDSKNTRQEALRKQIEGDLEKINAEITRLQQTS